MKKLEVKDLKDNFFEAIGKEWMLITAGTKEKFNTMTASWGDFGGFAKGYALKKIRKFMQYAVQSQVVIQIRSKKPA